VQHADERKTVPPKKPKSTNEEKINLDALRTDQEISDEKLTDMMEAIETACQMNLKLSWQKKQINTYARELIGAGFTPDDVDNHAHWWRANDWRGKKGDVPRLRELADTLQHSAPQSALRKQFCPDENVSAELHRRADQKCEICWGLGWVSDYDPRTMTWELCTCIGH
jgi:hypothetical protein